jgi:hypothetical protein
MGDTVGLNGNIASLSSGDPSLAVTVQEYDIVAGADTNGNGILDQSEVLANSTFLTGAPHSFKVVPPAVFTVNRTGALGATLFTPVLYPIASSLLQAFAGNVVPDGATTVQSVTIAKNELVHNVGAFFDSNGTAQIPSYGFPSSSLFAQKILFSPEFSTCVSNTLTAHTQEVRSYFNQASVGSSHQFVWQMISNDPQNSGNIIFPDSKDLFLAYGTTQSLNATVSATVVVNPSQQLELIQLLINGNIQDTYAWDYERGGVDAQAATIQAGFGTLGQGGQVYKTVVDLSGPFVLTSPYFF